MSSSKHSFLEEEEHKSEMAGMMRWLLTYADLITLLLGVFIVLITTRVVSQAQYEVMAAQAATVFGGGAGIRDYPGFGGKFSKVNIILPRLIGPIFEPDDSGKIMSVDLPKYVGEGGDISVETTAMGTKITLRSGLLFAPGKSELPPEAKEVLDEVYTKYLKGQPNRILINGHTDNTPIRNAIYPSNWELSTGRAGAVARFFIESRGAAAKQITTAGYADTQPADPTVDNNKPENRAKNRRVEIWLLKGQAQDTMELLNNPNAEQQQPEQIAPGQE